MINVYFKKLHPKAVINDHAREGDAGYDITAVSVEYKADIDAFVYGSGLALEFRKGIRAEIVPRSSNRKTDAYMPNTPATGDSGYRGEYMITFKNRKPTNFFVRLLCKSSIYDIREFGYKLAMKNAPYAIGDRIAQFIFTEYQDARFNEELELSKTARGEGGHGSTGK